MGAKEAAININEGKLSEKSEKAETGGLENLQKVEASLEAKTGLKKEIKGVGLYANEFRVARDMCIPMAVILCFNLPALQIFLVLAIFIFELIYFVIYRPYSDRIDNYTTIVNSFIYIVVLVMFFGLLIFKGNFTEKEIEKYWGNTLIGLLVLNIAVSLISCLIAVIRSAIESLIYAKKWLNKNKKVQESGKNEEKDSFWKKKNLLRRLPSTASILPGNGTLELGRNTHDYDNVKIYFLKF